MPLEYTPSKADKNLDPGHPFFLETLDAGAANNKFRSWWIYPFFIFFKKNCLYLDSRAAAREAPVRRHNDAELALA